MCEVETCPSHRQTAAVSYVTREAVLFLVRHACRSHWGMHAIMRCYSYDMMAGDVCYICSIVVLACYVERDMHTICSWGVRVILPTRFPFGEGGLY